MNLQGLTISGRIKGYNPWVPDNTNTTVLTHFNSGYTSTIGPTWTPSAVGTATVSISGVQAKFGTGSLLFTGNTTSSTNSAVVSIADQVAVQFGTGNFTLEAFVRPTSLASPCMVFSKFAGTNVPRFSFGISTNGRLQFNLQSNDVTTLLSTGTAVGSIITDVWQHVALVRNGNTFTTYINGINSASGSVSYNFNSIGGPFGCGAFINAFTGFRNGFNGYIDEIRLSKSAKYTGNFTPPPGPF